MTQVFLMITLASMTFFQPAVHLPAIAGLCLLIAFASASQDIVLDAYRREYLTDEELGIGSSIFVNGYRIGLLASGALALVLAEYLSWPTAYFILGIFMLIGIVATLYAPEPAIETPPPSSLREAFVGPFLEFCRRPGWVSILLFILLYKIGDSMASEMLSPFWVDLEVSKPQIAAIVKNLGGRGQSRPRKVRTLENTINTLFTRKLDKSELGALIKELQKRKLIIVNQGNVSYKLPH